GRVGPVERDELAGFEIHVITWRPFEPDGFGVQQFHHDLLDLHFDGLLAHKIVAPAKRRAKIGENGIACKDGNLRQRVSGGFALSVAQGATPSGKSPPSTAPTIISA